ncbi:MAG: DUF5615 family PIN-like protein [Flavobacteriales bacterium]
MKFLVDQNLSPKPTTFLETWFPGSVHTMDLHFDRTPDKGLWTYAAENGFSILTKDTDFEKYSLLFGAPPKVVWLRLGNASTEAVMHLIGENIEAIKRFLISEEFALMALGR